MRRIAFLIFFLIPFNSIILAQDFHKSFAISTCLTQDIINEYSVYVDYYPFKRQSFGLCLGAIHYNHLLDPAPLSPSQNEYPGTVYSGFVSRLIYSYFISIRNHKSVNYKRYISPQIVYKNLFYTNKAFTDASTKGGMINYTRNEKAYLIGGDLVFGWIFDFKRKPTNIHLIINPFVGLGYNYRYRDIETLTLENDHYWGQNLPVLGNEIKNQDYFTIIAGWKFGLHFCTYNRNAQACK
jgi:hypothetical protein